jgi:hypothetical protein
LASVAINFVEAHSTIAAGVQTCSLAFVDFGVAQSTRVSRIAIALVARGVEASVGAGSVDARGR